MLLIITHKTDFTADFVINKLNQRLIKYKRFNCEDILTYDCSVKFNGEFSYSILHENKFNAIWFRRTQLPALTDLSLSEKIYILNETDSLIKNLFTVIDAKWISNPLYVYQAENKLLQLRVAQDLGFLIPDTLITNSKEQLKSFYYEHNGHIIVKPISQTRIENKETPSFIFTNKITSKQINELNEFDLTPSIYQNEIEKEFELRITVVGDKVFSAAVDSQNYIETKIDWRKKKLNFRKIEIPKYLEDLCIALIRKLNLSFGAIDLIKTKDGNYIFLEVNPNGQWAWIEAETGLNISDAIINELIQK